jgi:hypothetical protein
MATLFIPYLSCIIYAFCLLVTVGAFKHILAAASSMQYRLLRLLSAAQGPQHP